MSALGGWLALYGPPVTLALNAVAVVRDRVKRYAIIGLALSLAAAGLAWWFPPGC